MFIGVPGGRTDRLEKVISRFSKFCECA